MSIITNNNKLYKPFTWEVEANTHYQLLFRVVVWNFKIDDRVFQINSFTVLSPKKKINGQ